MRTCIAIVCLVASHLSALAQPRSFAGFGPGISTLSGASSAEVAARTGAFALYSPASGPLAHVYAGRHLHEYLSIQGAWSWNRNHIDITGGSFSDATPPTSFKQFRSSSQHNFGVDGLLYFRHRTSWVRPYLSFGLNVMHFRSAATEQHILSGAAALPPASFTSNKLGFRSAAGIDVLLGRGWGIRYAFLEHIQANPIAERLQPKPGGVFMNFQNLFSLIKYF